MVARFGAFQKAQGKLPESRSRYEVKPLQKAADRKQLREEFQAVRQAQKQEREAIAMISKHGAIIFTMPRREVLRYRKRDR